jgi:hypothetical protein
MASLGFDIFRTLDDRPPLCIAEVATLDQAKTNLHAPALKSRGNISSKKLQLEKSSSNSMPRLILLGLLPFGLHNEEFSKQNTVGDAQLPHSKGLFKARSWQARCPFEG